LAKGTGYVSPDRTEYTIHLHRVRPTNLEGKPHQFCANENFDAHTHLWSDVFLPPDHPARGLSPTSAIAATVKINRTVFPGREIGYLVLGSPCPGCDIDAQKRFIAEQIKPGKNSRGHRLTPDCRVEDIHTDVEKLGLTGLKP